MKNLTCHFATMQCRPVLRQWCYNPKGIEGSSTCVLRGFVWLLSHVIYLKLTRKFTEKELLLLITQFGKENTLLYFCKLEIDHVTQKPKETCQSTCGGPR